MPFSCTLMTSESIDGAHGREPQKRVASKIVLDRLMTALLARHAFARSLQGSTCVPSLGHRHLRHRGIAGLRGTGPAASRSLISPTATAMPRSGNGQSEKPISPARPEIAQELVDFINQSWTQFHAVGQHLCRLNLALPPHLASHISQLTSTLMLPPE